MLFPALDVDETDATANDLAFGSQAVQTGTNQADRLVGNAQADVLKGRGGNDVLIGRGKGDRLVGNAGRDILLGNQGSDRLLGGSGNDILSGGGGKDTLTGGGGRDTFVAANSTASATVNQTDVVTDFQNGKDMILLNGVGFEQLRIVQGTGDRSDHTLILNRMSNTYLLVLQQVNSASITADDFILGVEEPDIVVNPEV